MKKTKLFMSLASLCFALAVLTFGVFAAQQVNYQISGSITYNVQDVFVEVRSAVYYSTARTASVEWNNAYLADFIVFEAGETAMTTGVKNYCAYDDGFAEAWLVISDENAGYIEDGKYGGCPVTTVTMSQLVAPATVIRTYDSATGALLPDPDPEDLTMTQNLTFGNGANQGYSYFIVFEIKNYGSQPINVSITPTVEDGTNVHTALSCPTSITIGSNGGGGSYFTRNIYYGICLEDITANADATYELELSITQPQTVKTNNGYTLYKFADGYYRMQMGNYLGQRDVYWRLLTLDGNNVESTDTILSAEDGTAIFLQDTFTSRMAYLASSKYSGNYITGSSVNGIDLTGQTNVNANTYYTSDVRAYLTSSFANDLGITNADIYDNITERASCKDFNNQDVNDKFWLLSMEEAFGTSNGEWDWDFSEAWFNEVDGEENAGWTDRRMLDEFGRQYRDEFYKGGDYYWLRSPLHIDAECAYHVLNTGIYGFYNVDNTGPAVRAAFQLAL